MDYLNEAGIESFRVRRQEGSSRMLGTTAAGTDAPDGASRRRQDARSRLNDLGFTEK